MEAARPRTDPEAGEAPLGPSPQRWARGDDGDQETEEPQCKRWRTTASSTLSSSSSIEAGVTSAVGTEEDTSSEEASYASLVGSLLSPCSQGTQSACEGMRLSLLAQLHTIDMYTRTHAHIMTLPKRSSSWIPSLRARVGTNGIN